MRILITGSRNWLRYTPVANLIAAKLAVARGRGEVLYVRHGAAPKGADLFAHQAVWVYNNSGVTDIVEEAFPALWQHENCDHAKGYNDWRGSWYCKAAGPLRNERMLAAEGVIDEVHAYPLLPKSDGTVHMMRISHEAGIPVFNHGSKELGRGFYN